jgi:hypothetical protein
VLISGIVSFVVDNSETEFDERIDDVRQVQQAAAAAAPPPPPPPPTTLPARSILFPIDVARQLKAIAPAKKVFVPEVFSSTNGYPSNAHFNK